MIRNLWLTILGLLAIPAFAANPPSILNNSDHIVGDAQTALTAIGIANSGTAAPSASTLAVNQTCATGGSCLSGGSTVFINISTAIANALNTSQTEYQAGGTTTVTPSVAYQLVNQSSTGYTLNVEQSNYAALEAGALLYSMAYCGTPQTGDYPPVAFTVALPNNSPAYPTVCGYAQGIEFSVPAGTGTWVICTVSPCTGTAVDVSSPSATQEAVTAVFAAMKSNHPTWTWGDIKGALRQTATNWATGYIAYNASDSGGIPAFGYGNINYPGALLVSGTSAIYLQSPGMGIVNAHHYATITIYPFLTTRRAKEVVYIGGTWPAASSVNELTAAQVTAAGGTKIIDDGGTTGVQTFTYAPAATGSATFTALTLDSAGNASRVESYNASTQSFTVGTACTL